MTSDWLGRLGAAVDRAPRATLAVVLAIFVVLWGLLPALVARDLPMDMIEQLGWGHEWRFAYYTHPPLPAWIVETVAEMFGGWDRPLFFVGPLVTALALWLIWRLARDIVGPRAALLAVLLQEGVLYFNYFTYEFNHNVVQLPLWALIGWTGRRAFLSGRTPDWIALGLAAGLGMMGKYSTGLLLFTLALFLLVEPSLRQRLRTSGPWLAFLAMVVVLIPHIVALGAVHYGPLHFPFERSTAARTWFDHIAFPAHFTAAQFADMLGILLLVAILWWDGRRAPASAVAPPAVTTFDRRYVATLCWGPFLLAIAISGIFGLKLHDMWGTPFWDFLGLFAVVFVTGGTRPLSRRAVALWLTICVATLIARPIQLLAQPVLHLKPARDEFPRRRFAAIVERGWHEAAGNAPLRYVAGHVWLGGNLAFAMWHQRPSLLIDGELVKSPWVDPAKLACDGAVLLWQPRLPTEQSTLLARFPAAKPQPEIVLPLEGWGWGQFRVGWAILPPDKSACTPPGGKN